MSTMVGEETELVVTADDADRGYKEIKKTGPINAFFRPVKTKQDSKLRLGNEISLNTNKEAGQATESNICVSKSKTAIVQETEALCSVSSGDGQTSKKKTSNLSGKAKLHHASFQEDLVKPNQSKPRWSVTCAVRNSSKSLNSSGSDFEDDGKSAFDIKTIQVQKSGKKKAKNGSRNNGRNAQENEGNASESTDNGDKESETLNIKKSNLSRHVIEKHVEQLSEKVKSHSESKALEKYEKPNQMRTSAFDVLMKSQRAQKLEDQRTETVLEEDSDAAIIASDSKSEISGSCEIDDNKGALQSKDLVLSGNSSSETNAFDFLMRKGRLGKSPSSVDSQLQSDLEFNVMENQDCSSKQKSKKKSFEFKLSIRASKRKEAEFLLESDYASSDAINCEEQSKRKNKRKSRKLQSAGIELVQCGSDESFVSEKCEDVVEVSKSKRGRKKTKVKSKVSSEEDQSDVSLLEMTVIKESYKSAQKGRKSGRKSTSNSEKVTGSAVANEGAYVAEIDCEPMEKAQIRGKRTKQQRKDNENNPTEIKDKMVQKARKKIKSGATSLPLESHSAELQQTSVSCDSSNAEDADTIKTKEGDEKKQKVPANESLSSTDSPNMACNEKNKEDSEREMRTGDLYHIESSHCTEPKTFASIFLKRKPVTPRPETGEQHPTMTRDSVLSSMVSSEVTLGDTTSKCSTIALDSSPRKVKSAAEQEAANRAFKALFTGACSQKMLPTATAAEALPAPWPLVSHVIQRDLGVNFWSLPWPVGKYHKSDDFSHNLSLDGLLADFFVSTSLSLEDRMMFCGKSQEQEKRSSCDPLKLETGTTQQNFPEAVTKKILLELALFYPGVPLKKLYRRYASKLEKHKKSSVAVECKQVENTAPVSDGKSNPKQSDNKEEKHDLINLKKGKVKRRLSSDGGVFQEKKVATKSEKSPALLPCESQGLLMGPSVNKSSKKRGREEENDQGQERGTKERRLSTRLQRKKACLESESVDNLEQVEATSNRKKRRRTSDHQKEVKKTSEPSIEQGNLSESNLPAASDKKKNSVDTFVSDILWTDLFRPLHSTEVMANASAVSKLRSWLEEWKVKRERTLRKELQQQKRLLAKQKGQSTSTSQASSHMLEWWDNDSDSDFQMSDNASDDSDSEGVGLSTAMFISGPTGVGKTAMVYACAEELGYKVFEVNSSSKRSGKHILSQLEEATQSHLVINNKGPATQSSFAGLLNKPVNSSSPASGPLGAFLSANATESDTKTKKGEKGKKKQKVKEKKKDKAEGKVRSILKQPPEAVNDDTESCSSLSSKAASLILFEEVDVIFEEDKSFWMAVNSFMQNAKCPIVLISRGSQVSCEGRYEQINLKPPSVNLLAAHLQLVALTNNMFVNPEDLKSLVAQNNCDIRKSFIALQFWSASGGGVKIPYERPAGIQDKGDVPDKHPKPPDVSGLCNSNIDHGKTDIPSSQDVLRIKPPLTSGILNDDGEESMFLSLSDWQAIKNRGTRHSPRTIQRGSLQQYEDDKNSDSDFCDPKKKTLVCTDGTTDSIFEITDTNDSQPVSTVDKKTEESPQLPLMDSLLFESSYGLLNCVADRTVSSLSVLQNKNKPGDIVEDCLQSSKLHLTHFTQGLDVNIVQANLSDFIPLFGDSSTPSAQTKHDSPQVEGSDTALPVTEHVSVKSDNIFFDKSLFDDGMEESGNYVEHDSVMETNQMTEKESEDNKAGPVPSSQESTDTGFSESQPKEEIGKGERGPGDAEGTKRSDEKGRKRVHKKPTNDERCCTKALDIFAQFVENLSFSDAFCPSLSCRSNTQSTSAEFGWWDVALKPGLTDEHVTAQDYSHWLARDTRASLRGAVEVANLESCRLRVNSLLKDMKQIENSTQAKNTSTSMENEQYDFKLLTEDLLLRESNAVVRFDALTQSQKSSMASHRKLHSSLCSCIPALYHCDHRCVAGDYIPTFRLLCHSERLREAANIKRRFLHYLDLNSFPLSRSTMEALADTYLAQ